MTDVVELVPPDPVKGITVNEVRCISVCSIVLDLNIRGHCHKITCLLVNRSPKFVNVAKSEKVPSLTEWHKLMPPHHSDLLGEKNQEGMQSAATADIYNVDKYTKRSIALQLR